MPASSATINSIQESFQTSLSYSKNDKSQFNSQLAASSKKILMQKIEFQPAKNKSSFQIDQLKTKYKVINANSCTSAESVEQNVDIVNENWNKTPLPLTDIDCSWNIVKPAGSGLKNMGNTCFLNSVLQVLTYCAPLYKFLQNSHNENCKVCGFCMLCELRKHSKRCLMGDMKQAVVPGSILQNLRTIAKHMQFGRQEDAHEFLRYVTDAMIKSTNKGNKVINGALPKTAIHDIFGGVLRSQVQCFQCHTKFNKFDPCLDLSVDIKNVNKLTETFDKFVKPDILDGDNMYMCSVCKKKTRAKKSMRIHQPPKVLTIQLKRFGFDRFGSKINRHIEFKETFNLRPFMSQPNGENINYELFGVIVHSGHSCSSGHYYSYIRAPDKFWYCANDSYVNRSQLNTVLNQNDAYILFYLLKVNKKLPIKFNNPDIKQTSSLFPNNSLKLSNPSSYDKKNVSNDNTNGISKKIDSEHHVTNIQNNATYSNNNNILPQNHGKISFGFGNGVQKSKLVIHSEKKLNGSQNGIRLTVGKSLPPKLEGNENAKNDENGTLHKSTNSISNLNQLNKHAVNQEKSGNISSASPTKLVPYQADSSDEEETTSNTNLTNKIPKIPSEASHITVKPMEPLHISNPSITKTNSTTSWIIMDVDYQPSSVTSNSSTNSVSSTTQWQISDVGPKNSIVDFESEEMDEKLKVPNSADTNKNLNNLVNGISNGSDHLSKTLPNSVQDNGIKTKAPECKKWDHYIDGKNHENKSFVKTNSNWNGVACHKSNDVINHLEKNSFVYGNIKSWNGAKSMITKEIDENKKNIKRSHDMSYDDEFDVGKVKKIKKPNNNDFYNKTNLNPFQKMFEMQQNKMNNCTSNSPFEKKTNNFGRNRNDQFNHNSKFRSNFSPSWKNNTHNNFHKNYNSKYK